MMACCFNASVAAGSDLDVRGASYLVCQRRFRFEENSLGMVASLANRIPLAELMTELIPVCLVAVFYCSCSEDPCGPLGLHVGTSLT